MFGLIPVGTIEELGMKRDPELARLPAGHREQVGVRQGDARPPVPPCMRRDPIARNDADLIPFGKSLSNVRADWTHWPSARPLSGVVRPLAVVCGARWSPTRQCRRRTVLPVVRPRLLSGRCESCLRALGDVHRGAIDMEPTLAPSLEVSLSDALDPSLFIGSSGEALKYAKHLQAELDRVCEPTVWTQGVFDKTAGTLQSLIELSTRADFAVLLLTPDDDISSRGVDKRSPRDNVVFELGLFLGALGADRVFIVSPRETVLDLPTDLAGISRLDFNASRQDGNLQAAMGPPATKIEQAIDRLGLLVRRSAVVESMATSDRRGHTRADEAAALDKEVDAIVKAATAQSWKVKTRSDTALRLVAPNGNRYSFPVGEPARTRDELRLFARQLKAAGLRISSVVLSDPV